MQKKILITEEVPEFFIKDLSSTGFEVSYKPHLSLNELRDILPVYHAILIRSRIVLNKELLESAANLEIILRPGSGLDIIDNETAAQKNIIIFNSPEGNRDAVGEHTTGLLLSILNHIHSSFNEIIDGKWERKKNTGTEVKGKKIGIIGFGNTGSCFAKKISSFEAIIFAYDKYKTGYAFPPVIETDMTKLINEAEIISLHIPLNKETNYLVDKNYLQKFKNPILLINTSRGKIIKTVDLLWAIENGIVNGAALDVLENENLSGNDAAERKILERLIQTGKVLITPHVAGLTTESEHKIFSILIEKLLKYTNL